VLTSVTGRSGASTAGVFGNLGIRRSFLTLTQLGTIRFLSKPSLLPNLFNFRLFSHSHIIHNVVDDAVNTFYRMLQMRNTPSIIEFNKILGSLVIPLFQQMEFHGIRPSIITITILRTHSRGYPHYFVVYA
jgi:hypothetical protein